IATLVNEEERVFQGARRVVKRVEACFPKNSVCLHLRGDQTAGDNT
ncbi:MAG: hypothetical protein JWL97_762, partial [Gemmatimonadales bacterium]|nr:hypothetical protein [Gemmatimonadales bacterium]MDB4869758.1 hypothetical protein [Gemmatimonadales bacterium]